DRRQHAALGRAPQDTLPRRRIERAAVRCARAANRADIVEGQVPTDDRWYMSGSLGIGTAFDEPTDASSGLSLAWANVGSAVRRDGGETLNLLESAPASVNKGPSLNLWGLNAGMPPKAVRLASIASRFATAADGVASSYLSFSTKPANGDLA